MRASWTTGPAARLGLAVALGAALGGCDVVGDIFPSSCDRSDEANPPILYTEGTVTDGVYMSSDWDGELLDYPGGRRYRIEHKLGARPKGWQAYLSFDRYGNQSGVIAQATGNQVQLLESDDETMTLVNGQCADYWLLVVAWAGDTEEPDLDAGTQ